jgi:Uma2 family endonuclease
VNFVLRFLASRFTTVGEFHLAIDILTRENIQGAPDLVIEVLSPRTEKRDRTIKLEAYSKFGVHEYWMADEEKATVEVWRRRGKKLALHAVLDKKQTLTTPLLPGLRI